MKPVGIAELKAKLSGYLRAVRRGRTVVVRDRDTPIAQIVPYGGDSTSLMVRHPAPTAPPLHQVPIPPPLKVKVDVVALLLEERRGER